MQTCTRRLEFDAAHRITTHGGKCAHLHGHRYRVDITCAGPLNDQGMVIDFGEVKTKLGRWIDTAWDHGAILNVTDDALVELCMSRRWKHYAIPGEPTAEVLAKYLHRRATVLLVNGPITVVWVRVYETPNCWAD